MEQSKQQKSEGEVNHVSKEIQRNKARQKEEKNRKRKTWRKEGGKTALEGKMKANLTEFCPIREKICVVEKLLQWMDFGEEPQE